jgi:H+/gluconate symporter-like permease
VVVSQRRTTGLFTDSYFFFLLSLLTPKANATGTSGISTLAIAVPSCTGAPAIAQLPPPPPPGVFVGEVVGVVVGVVVGGAVVGPVVGVTVGVAVGPLGVNS